MRGVQLKRLANAPAGSSQFNLARLLRYAKKNLQNGKGVGR